MTQRKSYSGSCLCHKVQFKISEPFHYCATCHCSICRRQTGGDMTSWLGVSKKRFDITKGIESIKHFTSSPGTDRAFCKECGSSLFWLSKDHQNTISVTLNSIHDNDDISPEKALFIEDKAHWS